VIVTHPAGERDYREDDGLAEAAAAAGVPVAWAEVTH
jgi:hypothetical protein